MTTPTGTLLTCTNDACGCRVQVQVPCPHGDGYACACGHPMVPVVGEAPTIVPTIT